MTCRGRTLLWGLACSSALVASFTQLAATADPLPAGQGGPPPAPSGKPPVPAALPPIALHPKSAASLAESKRLAADAETQDDWEKVTLLRRAIEVEPANHDARMAFAGALLEDHPDEALAILTAIRTALNNTGCRECLENFAGFVWNAAEGPNAEKVKQLASGLHGPPTRVTAAAEAVWKAFTSGEWRQLAPYVGPMTRVHVRNYLTDPAFGGDGDWTKRLSRRALRSFLEERHGYDPTRGDNWFCDARCCEYWTANQGRGDLEARLTRVCFATTGARPTLTRLDWEDG